MAGKPVNTQLNIKLNLQSGKGAQSFAQQISSEISKALAPALEKALEKAFKQANVGIAKAAKESVRAETTELEKYAQLKAGQRRKVFQQRAKEHEQSYKQILSKEEEIDRAYQLRAQQQSRSRAGGVRRGFAAIEQMRRGAAPVDVGGTTEREVAQFEVFEASEARARERTRIRTRRQAVQQYAAEARAAGGYGPRPDPQKELQERRQLEYNEAVRREYRAETRKRAAEYRRETREAMADVRAAGGPGAPPLTQKPEPSAELARSRRLDRAVPGAKRLGSLLGIETSAARGLMGLGSFGGGVASGNVFAGAAGGGGGALISGAGLGGTALAGVVAAVGAAVVGGIYRGLSNVEKAVQFSQAMRTGFALNPGLQGNARAYRRELMADVAQYANFGMAAPEALSVAQGVQRIGGGFTGDPLLRAAQRRATFATLSGIDQGAAVQTEGALLRAGRLGGVVGGIPTLQDIATRGYAMGLSDVEIGQFGQMIGRQATQFEQTGVQRDVRQFMAGVEGLSGMVGPMRAMNMAESVQDRITRIGQGQINDPIDLMILQSVGGLDLGGGGGTAAGLRRAAKQATLATPQAVATGVAKGFERWGGRGTDLGALFAQRALWAIGAGTGQEEIDAILSGQRAATGGPIPTPGRAVSFLQGGGFEGRAQAQRDEVLGRAARVTNLDIESGLKSAELSQNLDQGVAKWAAAMSEVTKMLGDLSSVIDSIVKRYPGMSVP